MLSVLDKILASSISSLLLGIGSKEVVYVLWFRVFEIPFV